MFVFAFIISQVDVMFDWQEKKICSVWHALVLKMFTKLRNAANTNFIYVYIGIKVNMIGKVRCKIGCAKPLKQFYYDNCIKKITHADYSKRFPSSREYTLSSPFKWIQLYVTTMCCRCVDRTHSITKMF